MVESDRGTMHLVNTADGFLGQCDFCRAFDKAPHAPITGLPAASMFNGGLRANLLFPGDAVALPAMDGLSKCSLLIPARSENTQEVRDAFGGARIGGPGQPRRVQMGEGGEWKKEV